MSDPPGTASSSTVGDSSGGEAAAIKPSFSDVTRMIQEDIATSSRLLRAAQELHAETEAAWADVEARKQQVDAERASLIEHLRSFHQSLTTLLERLERERPMDTPAEEPTSATSRQAPDNSAVPATDVTPPALKDASAYVLTVHGPRTIQDVLTLDNVLEQVARAENIQPLEFVPGIYRVAVTVPEPRQFLDELVAQAQVPLQVVGIEAGQLEVMVAHAAATEQAG
jgi:hypothetical protein